MEIPLDFLQHANFPVPEIYVKDLEFRPQTSPSLLLLLTRLVLFNTLFSCISKTEISCVCGDFRSNILPIWTNFGKVVG